MRNERSLNTIGMTYVLFEEGEKFPFYIGVTNNIKKRMNKHKNDGLNKKKTHCARKIRKILLNNKTFYMNVIINNIKLYEAFEYEKIFIKWCKDVNIPITNMTDGGDCGPVSYGNDNPSKRESVRKKISKAKKGRQRSDIALRDHSNYSKPVNVFDMSNNFIISYPSIREAMRKLFGELRRGIHNCLSKNKKCGELKYSSNGYKWSFV